MAATLWGHHSFVAEFSAGKPVHLAGIVERFEFVNPHVEIFLAVGAERWWIEAASPQALMRRGVSKSTLRTGSRIEVDGYRAKDGSRRVYGRSMISEGRSFVLNPN